MSIVDWAKKEVEIACKRENPEWDGKSFDYGCGCYMSALKAYESLMEEGHSGCSFAFTRNILLRLMHNLPLTPITEDDFKDVEPFVLTDSDTEVRQCPRMSSLFQETKKDGTITYSDVERYVCYDIEDSEKPSFTMGCVATVLNSLYPIKLPYYPPTAKYKIFISHHYEDKNKEEFSGITIHYIITPDGDKVPVDRVIDFKE